MTLTSLTSGLLSCALTLFTQDLPLCSGLPWSWPELCHCQPCTQLSPLPAPASPALVTIPNPTLLITASWVGPPQVVLAPPSHHCLTQPCGNLIVSCTGKFLRVKTFSEKVTCVMNICQKTIRQLQRGWWLALIDSCKRLGLGLAPSFWFGMPIWT